MDSYDGNKIDKIVQWYRNFNFIPCVTHNIILTKFVKIKKISNLLTFRYYTCYSNSQGYFHNTRFHLIY